MGVVSAFFSAPQLDSQPLTSCLLGSLAPWLLGLLQFQVSGQRVGQFPVDVFGPFSQARS